MDVEGPVAQLYISISAIEIRRVVSIEVWCELALQCLAGSRFFGRVRFPLV